MSTVTIQMPESLAQQIREWAAREGVSVDQLLSSAAAEKLSALMTVEHLRERARRPLTCRRWLATSCDARTRLPFERVVDPDDPVSALPISWA
jgi:hypothetical protein